MTINPYLAVMLAIAVFAFGFVVGGRVAARCLGRTNGPSISADPQSDESLEWRARALHSDPEITD